MLRRWPAVFCRNVGRWIVIQRHFFSFFFIFQARCVNLSFSRSEKPNEWVYNCISCIKIIRIVGSNVDFELHGCWSSPIYLLWRHQKIKRWLSVPPSTWKINVSSPLPFFRNFPRTKERVSSYKKMHYNNAEIENVTRFHVHCISNRINFFNMENFKNCGTKFNY